MAQKHPPATPDARAVANLALRHAAAVEHHLAGRPGTAVPLLEQILIGCRAVLGDRHPDTLVVAGNLAVAYLQADHTDDGFAALEEACAERERVLGADDPRTLTARDCLAAAHLVAGRTGEAMRLGEAVALARERVLGPDHPDTLASQLGPGLAYAQARAVAQAVAVLVTTLDSACAAHGSLHRHTIEIRAALACCRAAAGERDAAVEEYDRAIAFATDLLGADHPETAALRDERDECDATREPPG